VHGALHVFAAPLELVLLALFALTLGMAAATVAKRLWDQKRSARPG
jgi:hypothetical protein